MSFSVRDRADRNNMCVIVTGGSGTGKSRMGLELADDWTRVIYIDPTNSFDGDVRVTTYEEFVREWEWRWLEPAWRIVVSCKKEQDYAMIFADIWKVCETGEGRFPAFLVVFDESDEFSSPHNIDPNFRQICKRGRHFGVSVLVICQFDADTNRAVRGTATEWIIYRQGMLSPEITRRVKAAEKARKTTFVEVEELCKHNTKGQAVEGIHFLAVPEPFDEWREEWRALAKSA